MIQCAGCGSNLVYDIARKKMYCKACGNEYEPESVDKDEDSEERKLMELTVFICPQCGGEIYSTDESATGFCSYCGAATMLSSRLKSERRPDYVIPFAVTKDMCKASYATVMKRAIYAPNRLKHRRNVQEFRGIYMPYWLCDVDQKGKTAVRATDSYSSGVDTVSHTYNVRCFADNHYENITMDASSLFPDDLSSKVAPFDSADMKPFSMGYLSGFYADLPDVDYGVYRDKIAQVTGDMAYDVMMSKIKHHLCTYDAIGEPEEPLSETMDIKITGAKTGLFPVWLLSYKNGKRIAYAAVNGSTGKVAADIPLDIGKFLLGCLIGVAPLYFLLNLFLTVRPGVLLAFVSASAAGTMIWLRSRNRRKAKAGGRPTAGRATSVRHSGGVQQTTEPDEKTQELARMIRQFMETSAEIYQQDFSLEKMAAMLGIHTRTASRVINEVFGINFSTLLSQYRIEEACRRLSSPEYANVTIQAVAVDIGFRSRSNFAMVFKKFTGVSPNEYQKEAFGKKASD